MGTQVCYAPAPRGRFLFFSILALSIIGTLYTCARAQTQIKLSGQVVDSLSGNPAPGATIEIQDAARTAVSDHGGNFIFSDIPQGSYSLIAKRLGYRTAVIKDVKTVGEFSSNVIIRMLPEPVNVAGQTVTASRSQLLRISYDGNRTTIELPRSGMESIENIARQAPELQIVDSGSRKLLRLRGADFNATAIMLDGRVINSVLTSQGDISSIPFNAVCRIEIVSGGIQPGGLAGSVNFITRSAAESDFRLSAARGSFGYENYAIQLERPVGNRLKVLLDTDDSYRRGDFRFTDPRDSLQTRRNNYAHDIKLFGALNYDWDDGNLELKARYFDRDAGVPGQIFQLTPDANSRSRENEIYSSLTKLLSDKLALQVTGGLTFRNARYDSPQTPANFIAYKTKFDEQTRDLKLRLQKTGKLKVDFDASLRYESLDGRDLIRPVSSFGRHSRLTNSLGAEAILELPYVHRFQRSFNLTSGLRFDGGVGTDFWAPSAALRTVLALPLNPGLDAAFFYSRRLPGMTDLYWKEDVFAAPNPDLLPERSSGYSFGGDIRNESAVPFTFRAGRFVTSYDDIIIWRKWAGDKFKPVNLSQARIAGWELSFQTRPFSGPVMVYWNGSFTRPLNKEKNTNHYDKYLTFRPIGRQSAGLEISRGPINIKIAYRHIGRRYTTEENTKVLDAIAVWDANLEFKFNLPFNIAAIASLSTLNLADRQYELLDRQPESRREFRLQLKLSKPGSIL